MVEKFSNLHKQSNSILHETQQSPRRIKTITSKDIIDKKLKTKGKILKIDRKKNTLNTS
jgi:DNA-directed RNA polymerase subunit H (RpoH/RPB5)